MEAGKKNLEAKVFVCNWIANRPLCPNSLYMSELICPDGHLRSIDKNC